MDDALRRRLDAVVVLLATIAALLAGVLVALGGARVLAALVLVGLPAGVLGWAALANYRGPDDADAK
ncbi:hypothetical protein [Halorussus marinus]|uniref:hypothetical protein n=1 Tax=Halorussus marinus TaxID=2505976 RepID=UPI00109305C0|nr:hypothetical protein [Halorussus marinus]